VAGEMERRNSSTNPEKGKGEKMEDYRSVTIMLALYKINTTALAERIREKIEEKGIAPGF